MNPRCKFRIVVVRRWEDEEQLSREGYDTLEQAQYAARFIDPSYQPQILRVVSGPEPEPGRYCPIHGITIRDESCEFCLELRNNAAVTEWRGSEYQARQAESWAYKAQGKWNKCFF